MSSDECDYKLDYIMLSSDAIQRRVSELAMEIEREYRGKEIIVTGVLKGAAIFMADLVRRIGPSVDVRMDFIAVSSYGDLSTSSGVVKIVKDMDTYAEDKNILLVEDIMDTGLTLAYLGEIFTARAPKSVRTCVLLEKPDRKKVDTAIDYKGFTIADEFVVGYGLDYAGRWRHLPDIWNVIEKK
ncbi:MAG: hypoxanthine phosphoribosyltransferase [Synergistaceae bacterium]|jgi:hypoxanthine phosphoribosyltransferase|nr:hypoxanthine phosphoribosyltransferase [Synergistaceae bacterium]